MKKVLFSLFAFGVLAFGILGSSNNNQVIFTAQVSDEVLQLGFPIQPPV